MSIFKHRHFKYDIIIWAVRWYCKYDISYRDLEDILMERGVEVDHSPIYRWVQYYAPKILDKLKWYWKPQLGLSWRVDETYVKVRGRWAYLYRALDKRGNTIDFYLSSTRNSNAAKRFLSKALKSLPEYYHPSNINTDKNPAYTNAISELKLEGKCSLDLEHRQIKYLNNIIESDHGKLKRLIKPTLGFKTMKTAYATIKGFELMRMFKKGRFDVWKYGEGIRGEIRIITDNLLAFQKIYILFLVRFYLNFYLQQRPFYLGDQGKKSTQAVFKKYKSIPSKTDEDIESPESSKVEKVTNELEAAVIAEKITIDPNFLIPEGTYIPCSLSTKFVSDVTGRITCTIAEDIYSASGCVKLIEKGTKAVGSYQGGTLQHGKARMFVIWTKLITPDFKIIKLVDTQVVGSLGEAGIEGRVNSHFLERFGGALMLSIVKDVIKTAAEKKQQKKEGNTVNINNMDNTKDSFALIIEKMLENSINIATTMYKKQGDIIGILVGRDIDFSKIYKLKMKAH